MKKLLFLIFISLPSVVYGEGSLTLSCKGKLIEESHDHKISEYPESRIYKFSDRKYIDTSGKELSVLWSDEKIRYLCNSLTDCVIERPNTIYHVIEIDRLSGFVTDFQVHSITTTKNDYSTFKGECNVGRQKF